MTSASSLPCKHAHMVQIPPFQTVVGTRIFMSHIPDIQRAWTVITKGVPAKALALNSVWPVPKKLEAGEVLIKVQAAALNPV